jgi:hypothetical protein
MKKIISLLFLTLVFGVAQAALAQRPGLAGGGGFTAEVKLNAGQQKTVPRSKVKIKFISVTSDSRCPSDVNCVWAGNAVVKLQVSDGRETKVIEINSTTGRRGDRIGMYAINLDGLTPKTNSKTKIRAKDYRVTISVNQITR